MISSLLYAVEAGLKFVKKHPQIIFALFLLLILPLAFLYTSNQFLQVGQANTRTLVYQRVGLLNDVFASLVSETNVAPLIIQKQIDETAALNGDITKFRVVVDIDGQLIPVAALDKSVVGVPEDNRNSFEKSYSEASGIAFPFTLGGRDYIQSFRAVKKDGVLIAYIFVEFDQTDLNKLISDRKQGAYMFLFGLYLFLIVLAYWLTKITNYQYLYDEVKKANKMKDLFTNMIAHELRAPLTAIRGYSSMSLEQAANDDQKKFAKRTKMSSERLLNIVNDLLDVARIESGKLAINKTETSINEIVASVTDELRVSAAEKSIDLQLQVTDEVLALVDKNRLHQALTNLVSNSIKYTKQGVITIKVENLSADVEIRVQDTGMGISAEDQKKLFAPFFRVDSTDVSQITGTGLGMWITRQLVELMGAKIGVESIKGVGTHIVITIPKESS